MKQFKRYLIAGWFDLMGIEAGVAYMRDYGACCTLH